MFTFRYSQSHLPHSRLHFPGVGPFQLYRSSQIFIGSCFVLITLRGLKATATMKTVFTIQPGPLGLFSVPTKYNGLGELLILFIPLSYFLNSLSGQGETVSLGRDSNHVVGKQRQPISTLGGYGKTGTMVE